MGLRVQSSSRDYVGDFPPGGAWPYRPTPLPPVQPWHPHPMPPALPVVPFIINPLTEEDVRRIIREELDRESPPDKA